MEPASIRYHFQITEDLLPLRDINAEHRNKLKRIRGNAFDPTIGVSTVLLKVGHAGSASRGKLLQDVRTGIEELQPEAETVLLHGRHLSLSCFEGARCEIYRLLQRVGKSAIVNAESASRPASRKTVFLEANLQQSFQNGGSGRPLHTHSENVSSVCRNV